MRRYRKGQLWRPPTAAESSATSDAVTANQRRPSAPQNRQMAIDPTRVLVKNNSGSNQDIGDVLAITNDTFLSSVNRDYPWVTGDSLDANNFWFPLCVLEEPIIDGGIGPALIGGMAVTKVNVGATSHTRAYPTSAAVLVSGTFGPLRIVSKLTSTGSQLVWCVIGYDWPILRGKLDGDLTQSTGYATMSVWSGATLADTGENVTVYDPGAITSGKKIASGAGLSASWTSGKWWLLTPYVCES